MRLKLILTLMMLTALAIPVVADEVDDLILGLKDSDSEVRASAAIDLGEIGDSRAVDSLIQALKDDKDSYVRNKAAEALGKIGDAQAVDPLIKALKDKEWMVRSGAAWALGKIGDARAFDPLTAAQKDEDPRVQAEAAKALENIEGPEPIENTEDAEKSPLPLSIGVISLIATALFVRSRRF